MKNQIIILLLVLSSYSYSQDFRNVEWGMNQKNVIEKESFSFFEKTCADSNNCSLVYKGVISGDSVWLWYQFLYDTLVTSSYEFYPSSTYLKSYSRLMYYLEMLTLKYGDPNQILWDWESEDLKYTIDNDLENADYNFLHFFITGELKRVAYQWEKSNMWLKLDISPIDLHDLTNMPFMIIDYRSILYEKLFERSKYEYSKDNL